MSPLYLFGNPSMETGARAGGDSFKTIVPAQVQECANSNDHSSSLGNKSQTPRMWKEVFFVWQMNCFAKLWCSSQNIQCVDDPYSDDQNIVYTVKDITHIGLGNFTDCVIAIDGKPMRLLIDLGGKVSILDEAVYRQHFTHHRLQPPTSTLPHMINKTKSWAPPFNPFSYDEQNRITHTPSSPFSYDV